MLSLRLADVSIHARQKNEYSEARMRKLLALLLALTIAYGAVATGVIIFAPAQANGSYGYPDEDL
jgi:hypothetical protein